MKKNKPIKWILKKMDDLSPHELYAIMQLRNEVFVVEQNCVYQDADNKDPLCYHLMGWSDDKLEAYSRIIPPGVAYIEPSIGRVVTSPSARGGGIGKQLMEQSINQVLKLFGTTSVKIGAQVYLLNFYSNLGFLQTSAIYLEDGIEHVEMVKS
ncbi:MAG: GNAT family N-acetyltransferase [Chitinophagaceae bacterium]|nr:GNAT family N-acetyltransferase [Chitinophagaceae bacterium]MBK9571089.1 GNAT family N-acetyltransferase [Chitinophagaceae bacterium]MBL0131723.1 GNAT family N-acetyltransferase [Chitinophagaceae bacterium]MBL0272068.1 GNAT family N-acetyltransferase [Chitinophagaceae bacterium]